jgi:5-methylcytosine-specific restriction endonuclease McrA
MGRKAGDMSRRRLSPAERVAIFNRAYGFCHICKEHIGLAERWDVEHVVALALGGTEAKMDTNLQPAHARCHAPKTVEDFGRIAKAKRVEARHLGAAKPRSSLSHPTLKRKLDGSVVPR